MDASLARRRRKHPVMPPLILKRAPIGSNLEDHRVLESSAVAATSRLMIKPELLAAEREADEDWGR
jgi:hypothetical protein